GLILTSSNQTIDEDSSECVLGLDTLGAKVKRGNIFAIKTININTGKFIDNTVVTILDQQGELSPIVGVSSNIGFFSESLHEEYIQDIIVQLEKEGCEPSTQVILFEKSYDDYKTSKAEEEGATNLVLNMSERYEMKEISGTIKNELNEVIESVEVKITNPDKTIIIVQTNANGLFTFTPIVVGTYKFQGGKDNYKSTDLISIEVYQSQQYLIGVK
ncbi:MAG: carboxypeptidase-like regulatory domain-containing protein, partial [Nitrosopumilus sp.]